MLMTSKRWWLPAGLQFTCALLMLLAPPAAADCCEEYEDPVPGSCQYVQGYIAGGMQGSALLVSSTGGHLRPLMNSLNQTYTHSGMITSWPYTVTHDDMSTNLAQSNNVGPNTTALILSYAIGGPLGVVYQLLFGGGGLDVHYGSAWIDEVALYNGQPGLITQDVSHGSSQTFRSGPVAAINPAPGYAGDINQYVLNMKYMGNPVYRQHAYLDLDGEWYKPVRGTQICYDTCYDSCYNPDTEWFYDCGPHDCNPHDCVADPQGTMCSGMVARATNTSYYRQPYTQSMMAGAASALFNSVAQEAHNTIAGRVAGYGVSDGAVWEAARGVADQVVNCFTYGDVWADGRCVAPADWNRSSWQWGTGPAGWYPNGMNNISPDDLFHGHSGGNGALQANGRYTPGIQQVSIVGEYTQCQYTTRLVCHPGYCY